MLCPGSWPQGVLLCSELAMLQPFLHYAPAVAPFVQDSNDRQPREMGVALHPRVLRTTRCSLR
jgi:hypothetical protein